MPYLDYLNYKDVESQQRCQIRGLECNWYIAYEEERIPYNEISKHWAWDMRKGRGC